MERGDTPLSPWGVCVTVKGELDGEYILTEEGVELHLACNLGKGPCFMVLYPWDTDRWGVRRLLRLNSDSH